MQMAKQRWLGGLVVGVSLGALGCGDDPATPTDSGAADVVSDLGAVDTGAVDSGAVDTGAVDSGAVDTGAVDTGAVDTGAVDAGGQDSGAADSGAADAGNADSGAADAGNADSGAADAGMPMPTVRTTPTNGSAVVLTRDDAIAVATNRTANSVSIIRTSLAGTPSAMAPTVIATADGEPWAAVVGNDDNTAYVILRRSQELIRIGDLRGTPMITGRVSVGSEPTGLAISPMGGHVYVANWADGTVSDVDISGAMSVARTINLNPALGGSGSLGPTVNGSTTRPGLAHPRAIVITNNGDTSDADETVYVTEFFSQNVQAGVTLPSDISRTDIERRGLVYYFRTTTATNVQLVTLPRFTSTGFGASGCFPNQLYAAAIKGPRLFVTSVCESPRGAPNAQENLFAAIMVVNTTTQQPETANHVLLTRQFQDRYEATATAVPDTAARRFPLIPNDISFLPSSNVAYVSSYGSDAVFRVAFNTDGTLAGVGNSPTQHFIDLGGAAAPATPGRLPIGIAVANTVAGRAVALNENTRNLSLIDLTVQAVAATAASAPAPTADREVKNNIGRRFFVTGLARWSRNGQGWGSCEGCHPDGLTDNVTWMFAAGPRQTISLDGTFDHSETNHRILNWTGVFDEVHDFEANTRGVSGGVGALVHRNNDGATPPVISNADRIVNDGTTATPPQVATATPQAGLTGATRSLMPGSLGTNAVRSTLEDWENIELYVRSIRPPRAPTNLTPGDVTAGRALFIANNCAGCHGSPAGTNAWTISRSFYDPSESHNSAAGTLRVQTYTGFPTAFAALNPATANGTGGAAGTATFRILGATITAQGAGGGDQISCVLRAVGTIGGTTAAPTVVAPSGVTLFEVRANGTTPAQGVTGFNPPALVGMGTGAPFFHAGNARTLEEALDNVFRGHHQAMAANFLDTTDVNRGTQIRQLAAFLVSIDDDTMPVGTPATLTGIGNPDLCRGFTP
jgi:hypothetical protein